MVDNAVKHAKTQAIAIPACSAVPTGAYVWTEQLTVLKVQIVMPLPTQDLRTLLVNLHSPNLNSPDPIRDAMELNTAKSERKLNAQTESKVHECNNTSLP